MDDFLNAALFVNYNTCERIAKNRHGTPAKGNIRLLSS